MGWAGGPVTGYIGPGWPTVGVGLPGDVASVSDTLCDSLGVVGRAAARAASSASSGSICRTRIVGSSQRGAGTAGVAGGAVDAGAVGVDGEVAWSPIR
ncbi:hypothetical protein ACQP0U_22005 [Micromonospora sp. CA-269861]|uniref:hypothetical protein n=1 Tax=Micromonospora sp. CA-269861 TaxID=3239968 RepID=UPI003D8F8FFB